ncbi:uncharacterized protein N7515_008042 [Penicillium bovifimosum]|uniref:Uncharacterized protein n=1 Tax=Penicillium bovifimosum TaxID=126998 RepID=A0A9W9GND3_9EURO|nr:uncharacterized protein N7515_008042 [Penicillium bovifimosum]KAJ5124217.1 hypothetical protein N7515_008042 [Penicillium bovifimosum]
MNSAFEAHPQCQPPNRNPTIFFTYDFIKNTYNQIKDLDADKFAAGDPAIKSAVAEADGRNTFATLLIHDGSGKLAAMTGADPSDRPDFGPEIKTKVSALAQ